MPGIGGAVRLSAPDLPIYGTYCFLPIFRRRTGRTVTRAREVR